MNIERLRAETPGCRQRAHFNNAGAALMPAPVLRAVQDYFEQESRIGGYETQAAESARIDAAYQSIARLLSAAPRNIAFTENATAAFALALSSIPFQKGDLILTTRNDYSSNQIQFLSLQKRYGIEVKHAPDRAEGGVDVAAMINLISAKKPRLVCATEVPTNSGLVQDVAAIGKACRDTDTLYLVDACQSVGQMAVDVTNLCCDFLSATSRKYLRGPRGSGFLYVSDRVLALGLEPLFIDMGGASWDEVDTYKPLATAKRFENWETPWSLVLGTAAAADYAMNLGLTAIESRVTELSAELRKRLHSLPGVTVLDKGKRLCGIVTVALAKGDPFELVARLREKNINTSAQGRDYAVIDYAAKGVSRALRISPHYYNTETEIELLIDALGQLLRR